MDKIEKMDDETFDGLVDNEVQQSVFWQDSAIRGERERNYQYYLGLPLGNEVEGRSQVVSWDVFETIESVLPDLLEIFLAGDNIGEFEPTGPEDEAAAMQATDYINHLVRKQNPGFLVFNTWFKDALLAKLGIVRAYWNAADSVKKERYHGLTEEQLTMLLDAEGVEIVAQEGRPDPADEAQRKEAMQQLQAMPPEQAQQVQQMLEQPPKMLYDVEIRVTRPAGKVCIDGVRPETFIISKRATKQADAILQGEIRPFTRSDLVEMGIDRADAYKVQDYDYRVLETGDSLKERAEHESSTWRLGEPESVDKSTEEVVLFCGYIKADFDGDGIAEWRYVLRGGNKTLKNVEADDGPDYCLLTPIPIPHSVYGMALADPVAPIQTTNTALQRQYLDSLYLANNPRTYAIDGQVNLDDLLSNRIGGVVRMKTAQAAGPLQTTNVSGEALQGIEFMDSRREARTGVTRYNQGLDADSLNKTATGVTKIMGKGDKRMLMIARIFAETGVKDLYRLVLRLVCQYQDKAAVVRLRNKFVAFDPREWSHEMDVTINVGLGTGDKTEQVTMWQQVIAMQQQAIQAGSSLADETNVYNSLQQLMKAMGIKGAELYFTDPKSAPPKDPPPPSPEEVLAKAQVETEQVKQQGQLAGKQMDLQIKQVELQIKMVELQQKQAELDIKNRDSLVKAATAADEQERKDRQELRSTLQPIMSPGYGHQGQY
ncbi:portal protein [Achromobacter aegrifaciens]|uniref:portal protein n=1 Tax=Achromobacter aegrifaciens TaxID=1287736 RepID=UPI000F73F703|nr:hypothetical protein [Achromobacter aegrifaciens]RSE91211.1 hypothetical protein EGU54_30955 [Achromobacter aegrifaciens]